MKKLSNVLILLVMLSMLLSACATPTVVATEPPAVVEPTVALVLCQVASGVEPLIKRKQAKSAQEYGQANDGLVFIKGFHGLVIN